MARLSLLLLASLVCLHGSDAAGTFKASLRGWDMGVYQGATVVQNPRLMHPANGLFTVGPYQWNEVPVVTSPGYSLSNTTFDAISTGVIRQLDSQHTAFATYVIDAGTGFSVNNRVVCSASPFGSPGAMTCSNAAGDKTAVFSMLQGADADYMDLIVTTTGTGANFDDNAVTLALYRTLYLASEQRLLDATAINNTERREQARRWVAGVYFLVAVMMLGVIFITASLLAWRFPGTQKKYRRRSIPRWMTIVTSFVLILSFAAGGVGWLVSGSIVGFAAIFMYTTYVCQKRSEEKKHKARRNKILAKAKASGGNVDLATLRGGEKGEEKEATVEMVEVKLDEPDLEQQEEEDYSGEDSNDDEEDLPCCDCENVCDFTCTDCAASMGCGPKSKGARYLEKRCGGVYDNSAANTARRLRYVRIGLAFVLVSFLLCLVVVFAWAPIPYYLMDRISGQSVEEWIQPSVDRVNLMTYGYDRFATYPMVVNTFNRGLTTQCGNMYNTQLVLDSEKQTKIDATFIQKYNINMTEYIRQNYQDYSSVNDWFSRKINPIYRPIAAPGNDAVIVSAADSRVIAFQHMERDAQFWLKSAKFNISTLIGHADYNDAFEGGALIINRLAPQDYHRFHSPVTGTIVDSWDNKGTLHSVNQAAMTSENLAMFNQRKVSIIDTARYGKVAFVSIGAVCVGSVTLTEGKGATVTKGQELGYYSFGGSTNVVIFTAGTMKFDDDLLERSRMGVETLVQQGMQIGSALN